MGVSVNASVSACYAFAQSARTYLDDGALAGNFEDLTLSCLAVSELDVHDLGELGELDIVEDDEWTFDIEHSSVINTGCDIVVSLRGSGVYLSE